MNKIELYNLEKVDLEEIIKDESMDVLIRYMTLKEKEIYEKFNEFLIRANTLNEIKYYEANIKFIVEKAFIRFKYEKQIKNLQKELKELKKRT